MTGIVPFGYDPGMSRSVVERVGTTVHVAVSDDRGNPHDLLFTLTEAEQLGRALLIKARTEGHDALDEILSSIRSI